MSERTEIDQILTGLKPYDFSTSGDKTNNRTLAKYTWDDFAFSQNTKPFESDTAIIVTSYNHQLGWLKASLESYRKTDAYVILSYDNPVYIWSDLTNPNYIINNLPHPLHYLLAHSVLVKHRTYDADKRIGWFWDVWYAQGIIRNLKNIKYVYVTNGDCLFDKPDGFDELKRILGDNDFLSGQSTQYKTIHTADILFKADAFHKVLDYMAERNKFHVMSGQSPETLLREAVNELGLSEKFIDYPLDSNGDVDYYCTKNQDSTFKRVVGFRNLYHEFEYCENNSLIPDFKQYMDNFNDWSYFRSDWRNTICRYYETGDRRYLYMFWDRGKDSQEDRKFLPIDAYGKEPIYD